MLRVTKPPLEPKSKNFSENIGLPEAKEYEEIHEDICH